jgi:AmmeMemoRadiSam system protein B
MFAHDPTRVVMSLRAPVVAGMFYPGRPDELRRAVAEALPPLRRERALAVLVPHAGYVYSGKVAAAAFGRVEVPADVVLLCFNHRGRGEDFAVWPEGAWRTPLGDVPVNAELVGKLKDAFPRLADDETGHSDEHSGEVQVPFLQVLRPDVRIAPVALSVGPDDRSFDALREFGRALASVQAEFLVVASTDLNHYEDQKTTIAKDEVVISAIERLDEEGVQEAVGRKDVSMCGYAPTIAAIAYAKAKGARRAETVLHATSGDVSGDYDKVVGYVGMIFPCGN